MSKEVKNEMANGKDYLTYKIMSINAYEIVFNDIIGSSVKNDERLYGGSVPISLDLLKIFDKCKKNKDRKKFLPYKPSKSAALEYTDVMVDVSFDNYNISDINKLYFPSDVKVKKGYSALYFNLLGLYYLNKKVLELGATQDYIFNLLFGLDKKKGDMDKTIYKDEIINKYVTSRAKEVNTYTEKALEKEMEEKPDEYKGLDEDALKIKCIELKNRIFKRFIIEHIKDEFNYMISKYLDSFKDYDDSIIIGAGTLLKLRLYVYKHGFDVDTGNNEVCHYVVYKRSASKSKQGSCVFIAQNLYDDMMDWTWMGLKFDEKEKYDLTSIKAYEALVMSSITNTVDIPSNGIVMLDSVESSKCIDGNWKIFANCKKGKGKSKEARLLTKDEYEKEFGKSFEHKNILWDGQALVDSSIFEAAGYTGDKKQGMMLLRNKFFKACAFNTNIKQYYADKGIKSVKDMFGRRISADKVKMIVTIDSFKLKKFASLFYGQIAEKNPKLDKNELDETKKLKALYEYWLKNIDASFGIVKEEHESHLGHGKYHEVSYQILNTLPLDKKDISNLIKDDVDYIEKLRDRNDLSVMLESLKVGSSARKKYFIKNMLKYAPHFEESAYYKDFVSNEVKRYKKRMSLGRIKIRGDFYVLCSMPMEMLEFTTHGDAKKIKHHLEGDEAYIKGVKDGEDITLFRYPHINSGSVCLLVAKECKDIDTYFNFEHAGGSNIIVVSPENSNIMVKLGGADFDSDTALYIKDETIAKAAKKMGELSWLSPAKDGAAVAIADDNLKGDAKFYNYQAEGFALLDHELARTSVSIGQISNYAQIFNSYLWDGYFNEKEEDYLKGLYDCILKLSVLNELEIDRAKHSICVSPEMLAKEIIDSKYIDGKKEKRFIKEKDKKIVVPNFMAMVMNSSRITTDNEKEWKTPVDMITTVLKEDIRPLKKSKSIDDLAEFFILEPEKDEKEPNSRKLNVIRNEISKALKYLVDIDKDEELEETKKNKEREECLKEFLSLKQVRNLSVPEIRRLLKYAFWKYKEDTKDGLHKKGELKYKEFASPKYKYRYLGFIFAVGKELEKTKSINPVIECISKGEDKHIPELLYNPYGDASNPDKDEIVLWGDVYKKVIK